MKNHQATWMATALIVGLSVTKHTQADVVVVATAFGLPVTMTTTNSYTAESTFGSAGVSKFKPSWGTLTEVEGKATLNVSLSATVNPSNAFGSACSSGWLIENGYYIGGNETYFFSPDHSDDVLSTTKTEVFYGSTSAYTGLGVKSFGLQSRVLDDFDPYPATYPYETFESFTGSSTFWGTISVKYTFTRASGYVSGDTDGDNDVDEQDVTNTVTGAIRFDLTNDGIVDEADVQSLFVDVLNTRPGDLDLDGDVDGDDEATLYSNFTANGTYGEGDINGDGAINEFDADILNNNFGFGT